VVLLVVLPNLFLALSDSNIAVKNRLCVDTLIGASRAFPKGNKTLQATVHAN
jgi:hypothetical protein